MPSKSSKIAILIFPLLATAATCNAQTSILAQIPILGNLGQEGNPIPLVGLLTSGGLPVFGDLEGITGFSTTLLQSGLNTVASGNSVPDEIFNTILLGVNLLSAASGNQIFDGINLPLLSDGMDPAALLLNGGSGFM